MTNAFALADTSAFASPLHALADVLGKAQSTASKTEKQDIVRAALSGPDAESLKYLLNQALSPFVTFGVKKIPEPTFADPAPLPDIQKLYDLGVTLLTGLADRKISGNNAKSAIGTYLGLLDDTPMSQDGVSAREAFRRILIKDMRAGFSESTVNKACPGTVPVFEIQLAPSEMIDIDKTPYPVICEPKYDGVRCVAMKDAGVVSLRSREGNPFLNFEEVRLYLTDHMPDNFVLDGEILSTLMLGEAGFKLVMKRCSGDLGKNVEGNPVRYQVFDCMTLQEWNDQKSLLAQEARSEMARTVVNALPGQMGLIDVTPFALCKTTEELSEYYAARVADGFEGIIVKKVYGNYEFKRSKVWQKLKPFESADLTIVGFLEGTGKYAGSLGAISFAGDHTGKKIEVDVGSGYSDKQRKEIWENRDAWLGLIGELRYQDIVKAEGSETHSLRFPTFQRIRGASAGEKL